MPADVPTVLATSGGFRESTRLPCEVGPLTRYAVELAGVVLTGVSAGSLCWHVGGTTDSLVADGTLPAGYATDDSAGLLYRGTELAEALAETTKPALTT